MPVPDDDSLAAVLAACTKNLAASGGEARRLFHGRGRQLPAFEHVCVDGFPPLVWVTIFRPLPPALEADLCAGLVQHLAPLGMTALAVQHRDREGAPAALLLGDWPPAPVAREDGLAFRIDPARGQNTGFFLDMRLARQWLRERAAGRSVLNLFAFTCAFSVAARAGGAAQVVNIDLSSASLATGRDNHRLNGQSLDGIHFLDHDIFRSWNKLHRLGRYDIVIMDPPTAQQGSFNARRDYAKVIRRFPKLLQAEADVLACLNSPALGEDFLDEVFARELPGAEKVGRLPNPPEFVDSDPQAALKVVHYRYRRPAELPPLPAPP